MDRGAFLKTKRFLAQTLMLLVLLLTVSCLGNIVLGSGLAVPESKSQGQIYLYGEQHGVDKIINKEFELWFDYYHNKNMRHLFIESPYYTAEFLNLWMQADNDKILNAVYNDWKGSPAYNPSNKEFFKRIKRECPETIFHGTDVGHQYHTTGERFLRHLETNNLEDLEQYLLAQEAIEQGEYFYRHNDHAYREQMMVENFIREFDNLSDENIMGIYGSAHTGLNAMIGSVPTMANQLKERYGDAIHSVNLTWLTGENIEPYQVETITINEKEYEAPYFGQQDIRSFSDIYVHREFWRLENAYEDFKDKPTKNNVLPYDNYPMHVEVGEVFVIDYTKSDGSVERQYFRSDGFIWNGLPSTQEFIAD